MTKKNDGGPAFPGAVNHAAPSGMSLRDWFAGQAMSNIGLAMMESGKDDGHPVLVIYEGLARASYMVADAMIAEREK